MSKWLEFAKECLVTLLSGPIIFGMCMLIAALTGLVMWSDAMREQAKYLRNLLDS
jgi:hypothetical protein